MVGTRVSLHREVWCFPMLVADSKAQLRVEGQKSGWVCVHTKRPKGHRRSRHPANAVNAGADIERAASATPATAAGALAPDPARYVRYPLGCFPSCDDKMMSAACVIIGIGGYGGPVQRAHDPQVHLKH